MAVVENTYKLWSTVYVYPNLYNTTVWHNFPQTLSSVSWNNYYVWFQDIKQKNCLHLLHSMWKFSNSHANTSTYPPWFSPLHNERYVSELFLLILLSLLPFRLFWTRSCSSWVGGVLVSSEVSAVTDGLVVDRLLTAVMTLPSVTRWEPSLTQWQ